MVDLKKLINPWSLGIAVIHLVVSVIITFMAVGATMARFDSGLPPNQSEQLIIWGAELLNFPMVYLASKISRFNVGVFGWLIFIFNSLLWGIAVDRCGKLAQKVLHTK